MTRTIIAGSREGATYKDVKQAFDSCGWEVTTIISGGARGVDYLGKQLADELNIPVERYPANWSKYGRGAGPIRNSLMADNADALIAVWDGKSKGTLNMINTARKKGLKVFIYFY